MSNLYDSFADELEKISQVGKHLLLGGLGGAAFGAGTGGVVGALQARRRNQDMSSGALRGLGYGALAGGALGSATGALSGLLMRRAGGKLDQASKVLTSVSNSPIRSDTEARQLLGRLGVAGKTIDSAGRSIVGGGVLGLGGMLGAIPLGGYVAHRATK